MKIIKALFFSLLVTLISLALPLVLDLYGPVVIDEHAPNVEPRKPRYSIEEIDAAEEKMKKEMEAARHDVQKLTGVEFIARVRKPFIWVTWVPWIFLAFLVRSMSFSAYLVALALPLALVPVGLIFPLEILFYCGATAISTILWSRVSSKGSASI